MDNNPWIPVVSTLLGTIIGFSLNIVKELFNKRFKTDVCFRDGRASHKYIKKIQFFAYIDIINKGGHVECVKNVTVKLYSQNSDYSQYENPQITIGADKKDATNTAFLVEPFQTLTVLLKIDLEMDINNTKLFDLSNKDIIPYKATALFEFSNRRKTLECKIPIDGIMEAINPWEIVY